MAIPVEHELHIRRRGRNIGLLVVLLAFVALVFGMTVVKLTRTGDPSAFEGFDHDYRYGLAAAAERAAAEAAAEAAPAAPIEEDNQ